MTLSTPDGSRNVQCTVAGVIDCDLLVDSGSDWNLLSEQDWDRLTSKASVADLANLIENPRDKARAYASAAPLITIRSFDAWISVRNATKPKVFATFRVVQNGNRSILGFETAKEMKLLRIGLDINAVQSEAKGEFPSIPNLLLEFDIDESVTPTKNAYVNIPAAYTEQAIERLNNMEAQNIIEKVTAAPTWISGMSAVPKGKSDFRLVINMIGPNRAIKRRYYKMPTLEEIKVKLYGSKIFTKLDLTNAFHHIKLGERSKGMTTFLSPKGMYRFTRMVFGVNCAPEAFQQIMEDMFRDVSNVVVYIDDLLIFAKDLPSLQETTEKVIKILKANCLTLNFDKCDFEKTELQFLGHKLTTNGLNIAEKKVEDIKRFQSPKNTSDLKSFLGLAAFVSAYTSQFATIAKPLWDLAKSRELKWTEQEEKAFCDLKAAIVDETVTQGFFNDKDITHLYTDASPVALGAVLVQINGEGKPRIIAFASKLLSPTESRYPQTQKEALGIVWGAEHFWFYLLGRPFTIKTDAQGIAFLFTKERTTASRILSRAAGWALRLSRFDFKVEYIQGKSNIADPSSRLVTGAGSDFDEAPAPGEIMTIEMNQPDDIKFGEDCVTIEEIKWHAKRDQQLISIEKAMETGVWTKDIARFKPHKNELMMMAGVITRTGEAVIPIALRIKTLAMAHKGHPGGDATKSILKGRVWWPGMLSQAENWVKSCPVCALMSGRTAPMPMQRSRLPATPWEELASDFCGPYAKLGGISILTIIDRYSRYMLASPVKSTDIESAMKVFSGAFDIFGYPQVIHTDNGPPFNGGEWKLSMQGKGIAVHFSTPLDPQQNGTAEVYMKLVGKAMAAPTLDGGNWRDSLQETVRAHNSAICKATGEVPEELMLGRRVRRNLPLIQPRPVTIEDAKIRERDWSVKMAAKSTADEKRSARHVNIEVGDRVYVSRPRKEKGDTNFFPDQLTVVAKKHGTLDLLSQQGNIVKRTVPFVKKVVDRIPEPQTQPQPELVEQQPIVQEKEDSQPEAIRGAPEPSVEPKVLRRSTRVKSKPAHLRNYIHLLGWHEN